jgi:hypothetical protein
VQITEDVLSLALHVVLRNVSAEQLNWTEASSLGFYRQPPTQTDLEKRAEKILLTAILGRDRTPIEIPDEAL